MKAGRNQPCPCGSGKKYKQCCLTKRNALNWRQKLLFSFVILVFAGGLLFALLSSRHHDGSGANRVWSEEHGHWHSTP
jgi:hypothetical protein